MVEGMGGGGLLDSVLGAGPSNVAASKDVLGGIFGSKDNSRAVAADASAKSDVPTDLLKKMLPLVAMLVAGYMAKQGDAARQGANQDGLGGMLGSVLGGMSGGQGAPSGGGLGGLASMLDMDGDGNPLDDIMGMVRR